MSLKIIIIGVVIIVVAGGILFLVSTSNIPKPIPENTGSPVGGKSQSAPSLLKAPEFNLVDYDGKTVRLGDFAGNPLVINSWAAWCPFCKKELPDFAAVQKEFGDQVIIIAIDRAESLETAKKYSDEVGATNNLVLLLDPSDSFYQSIGGFSMPETIFVNPEGLITDHKRGPMDVNEMRLKIKTLLGSKLTTKQQTLASEVTFPATDGYQISGTLWKPEHLPAPVVILAHQFNSDRHDFDSFAPLLLARGYAVLAYDIRGFGQSRQGPTQINDFPLDTQGAIAFLKNRNIIDNGKIAIIGASVGANVAFVASGSISDIVAAVALSPSNTGARGILLGAEIKNFKPHDIFIASDEEEKLDADFIFSRSSEQKVEKIYPGFGHGISLLRSEAARNDILDFLSGIFQKYAEKEIKEKS